MKSRASTRSYNAATTPQEFNILFAAWEKAHPVQAKLADIHWYCYVRWTHVTAAFNGILLRLGLMKYES